MTEWDATVDTLIVGSGGAALTAALVARARGLDALVAEKTEFIGGSTAMSGGGVWIPASPPMLAAGTADSEAEGLTYMNAVIGDGTGPESSPERRRAYIETGPRMVAFLTEQGIPFSHAAGYADYYSDAPGGKDCGRTIEARPYDTARLGPWQGKLRPGATAGLGGLAGYGTELTKMSYYNRGLSGLAAGIRVLARSYGGKVLGKSMVGNGGALAGRLLEQVLARGAQVWTDSPARELITDDGMVTGAIVGREGRDLRVRARHGVLLAAGGFSRNEQMRRTHGGDMATSAQWSAANPGDTGEVMAMAIALGAATAQLDEAIWLPGPRMPDGSPPPPYGGRRLNAFSRARWRPGSIVVDADGHRFVNEAISYMEFAQTMFARDREVKTIPAWLIFDDAFRRRSLFGVIPGDLPQRWIDDGFILKSATLAGLAEQAGIDPGGLTDTVRRFSENARADKDPDFHRGERPYDRFMGDPRLGALAPLDQAPFYASAIFPADLGTCGGLITDADGRVLTGDGRPIAGLYAAGNTTASVMGRRYLGAGSSIGPAFVFGYRAMHHIAGQAGATA